MNVLLSSTQLTRGKWLCSSLPRFHFFIVQKRPAVLVHKLAAFHLLVHQRGGVEDGAILVPIRLPSLVESSYHRRVESVFDPADLVAPLGFLSNELLAAFDLFFREDWFGRE